MYFIIYQPLDRSYTKFVSLTDKLTDNLDMAVHSLDLEYIREKCYKLQIKDIKGNYIIFQYVR